MMATTLIHAFEERGLGKAPFKFVREIDSGSIKAGHTCDFCGTGIRYLEEIRSSDGKVFHVGCECVFKTGDTGLVDTVKRAMRQSRAQAKYEKQRAESERLMAEQRERNGGKTDWEVKEEARIKAEHEAIAQCTAANQWLIDLLTANTSTSGWKSSMIYDLKRHPVSWFSERNQEIFSDMYARTFGRANSKAYQDARREAYERMQSSDVATIAPDEEAGQRGQAHGSR
jgi:hypothetical protein